MSIAERHAELWRAHLRLAILRFLAGVQGEQTNDSMLTGAVQEVGIDADRVQVVEALRFLAAHECVRIEEIGPVLMARITDFGELVTQGRRRVDGVQRPARG